MKFTILSHAGVCVEHAGVRVVCDPWLIGSCYWRSWWNFPEPPPELVRDLAPDFIYLTHLHWDHFHGPSLQRLFSRDTRILVPKVPTRRMVDDLQYLGFHHVTEVPHGARVPLGKDFTLQSYQFGLGVDSAAVFRAGDRVLYNANDCKHFGLPLRQITKEYPQIDFVLRSHSSASPLPYCVEGHTNAFAGYRTQEHYIEEFSRFALHIGARYAVPFASNHCFLHRDTFAFNETAVSPEDVRSRYQQLAASANLRSECVVMAPGSSWSADHGFALVPFDYSKRVEHVQTLLHRHQAELERQYEKEAAALVDFEAFRAYFTDFVRAIPRPLRRAFGPGIVFRTRDARGEHDLLVDVAGQRVDISATRRSGCVVIETPALVLNDCTRVRMFSVWGASKRLRLRLPVAQHLGTAMNLFSLLDLYELDMLPLAKNFTLRSLGVRARRWRDAAESVRLAVKHKVLRRRFDLAGLYALRATTR